MNKTTTTTETGLQVKQAQSVVPQWLETAITDGGGDGALFAVTRQHTPFGQFVFGVAPAGGAK